MRAWVYDIEEFVYPTKDNVEGMVEFYTILRGYELLNRKFCIDKSTNVLDLNGVEIYENDKVQVTHILTADEISLGYKSVTVGYVEYDDGCFVVVDKKEDTYVHVQTAIIPQDLYKLRVIGTKHDKYRTKKV